MSFLIPTATVSISMCLKITAYNKRSWQQPYQIIYFNRSNFLVWRNVYIIKSESQIFNSYFYCDILNQAVNVNFFKVKSISNCGN